MMDGNGHFAVSLQRSRGEADVGFHHDGLVRLYQRGAAKALLPRSHGPAQEIVLVNTAGGITGGDRYRYGCAAEASNVILTTQAAERAYRSSTSDIAGMDVQLSATGGAALHWLPQETILFDGCRLGRRIEVDLDMTSECLVLESLVFGRHAMGETLANCHFTDHWLPALASRVALSVWQGRLVLRLLAAETMAGKADLSRILGSIRGQQMPRVWQA